MSNRNLIIRINRQDLQNLQDGASRLYPVNSVNPIEYLPTQYCRNPNMFNCINELILMCKMQMFSSITDVNMHP